MKIWEVIQQSPLRAQKKQLDAEQSILSQKKKSLKIRTAQDSLSKAIKDRSESATKSPALSRQVGRIVAG